MSWRSSSMVCPYCHEAFLSTLELEFHQWACHYQASLLDLARDNVHRARRQLDYYVDWKEVALRLHRFLTDPALTDRVRMELRNKLAYASSDLLEGNTPEQLERREQEDRAVLQRLESTLADLKAR